MLELIMADAESPKLDVHELKLCKKFYLHAKETYEIIRANLEYLKSKCGFLCFASIETNKHMFMLSKENVQFGPISKAELVNKLEGAIRIIDEHKQIYTKIDYFKREIFRNDLQVIENIYRKHNFQHSTIGAFREFFDEILSYEEKTIDYLNRERAALNNAVVIASNLDGTKPITNDTDKQITASIHAAMALVENEKITLKRICYIFFSIPNSILSKYRNL
jgi:hypothetical protein